MKNILLVLFLAFCAPAFSQITKDSVAGTWAYDDAKGGHHKLVITQDSVTVFTEVQNEKDSNEWFTMSYTGSYTIVKGDQIHVIFNDKPREEAFYKVVRAEDGSLQIVVQAMEKKKKVDLVYKRQ